MACDVLDSLVLGYRADGRPVLWVRGGAGEGDAAAAGGDAGGGEGAPAAGEGAGGVDDGAEELEFSEESFKALIDKHNALQAAQEAEREDWRKKLHAASQDASRARQRARDLAAILGEESTGKPGPKSNAAKASAAAAASVSEADTRLAELSAQLEETRRDGLLLGARSALAEAGVPKAALARAVRLIDLELLERRGAGEIGGLDEQITELKESMPQLFAPAAAAPTAAVASGAGGGGARILRAAPPVAGRGAAGRGGEAPKVLTAADKLANEILYGNREGQH